MTKKTLYLASLALTTALVVACGGGDSALNTADAQTTPPAPTPPAPAPRVWGGPLAADKPLAKAFNDAALAFSESDNPILRWHYQIWCVSGYRMLNEGGTGQPIDEPLDPKLDLASPKGFIHTSLAQPMPAGGVKFMDNAWYFGTDYVGVVIVRTQDGLVMFDSASNPTDMKTQVIDHMAAAGLDPKQIKYIFLGHEHGDHTGGANFIKQNYSADVKIVATRPATTTIAASRTRAENATYTGTPAEQAAAKATRLLGIPEKIDTVVEAYPGIPMGLQKVVIGPKTEVTAMLTPGHTPGQMTVIVPVEHNGIVRKLVVWSGNDNIDAGDQYAASTDFAQAAAFREGADAFINTHPYQGAIFRYLRALKANPAATNPMLMGVDGVQRYFGIYANCQRAGAQRLRDGTWKAL